MRISVESRAQVKYSGVRCNYCRKYRRVCDGGSPRCGPCIRSEEYRCDLAPPKQAKTQPVGLEMKEEEATSGGTVEMEPDEVELEAEVKMEVKIEPPSP